MRIGFRRVLGSLLGGGVGEEAAANAEVESVREAPDAPPPPQAPSSEDGGASTDPLARHEGEGAGSVTVATESANAPSGPTKEGGSADVRDEKAPGEKESVPLESAEAGPSHDQTSAASKSDPAPGVLPRERDEEKASAVASDSALPPTLEGAAEETVAGKVATPEAEPEEAPEQEPAKRGFFGRKLRRKDRGARGKASKGKAHAKAPRESPAVPEGVSPPESAGATARREEPGAPSAEPDGTQRQGGEQDPFARDQAREARQPSPDAIASSERFAPPTTKSAGAIPDEPPVAEAQTPGETAEASSGEIPVVQDSPIASTAESSPPLVAPDTTPVAEPSPPLVAADTTPVAESTSTSGEPEASPGLALSTPRDLAAASEPRDLPPEGAASSRERPASSPEDDAQERPAAPARRVVQQDESVAPSGDSALAVSTELPARRETSEVHEDFDVPDARPRRDAGGMVRAFRDSPLMFFEQDADLRYVVVHNPPVLTEELVLGKMDGDIFEPKDARRIIEIKRAVLETGTPAREEIEVRLGGQRSSFELLVEPRFAPDGPVEGIVGILLEIGGRKRAEVALLEDHDRLERRIVELSDELEIVRGALEEEETRRHRAEEAAQAMQEQDPLTGLPTRRVFNDRLAMSIVHSRRQRTKFAVVILGLDGFRGINDSMGRSVGDALLRSVATVLEQSLRQGDTVSRLGGDEFVLLLPGFLRDDDVVKIAEKLRMSLRSPFTIGTRHVSITGSLGIAVFPDDGANAETLLQNAAVALRRAKEKGGDAFDVHAPATNARATKRVAIEGALRKALVSNRLSLHYQPIVDAASGRIVSLEALLRFRSASGRLVQASEFLRELDATSLAVPLGLWSLRTACAQVHSWRQNGFANLTVAVNLTGRQLLHPSLVALVRRALDETGLPAEGLDLEVGEGDLVKSADPALARLSELKRLGVGISVDDFGTGESLISRLQRFPVDAIKIDRSVIKGIAGDESQKGVAAAAIALARARHLEVIAEGVETQEQRSLLVRWRCDRLQGNLCGAPVPAEQMGLELAKTARG